MRTEHVLRATCAALLTCAAACAEPSSAPVSAPEPERPSPAPGASAPEPVAVVELFTSEGCSSCPPADAVLARIAASQHQGRVVALAFHVDYWDGLGWKDPWADAAWTARQRSYARRAGESGVYTPQMIVNAARSFVGSDESSARAAVRDELAAPAAVDVGVDARFSPPSTWSVGWRVGAPPPGSVLHVALTQNGLVSRVPRGENAGRTLTHEHVVRAMRSVPLDATPTHGTIELSASGSSSADAQVVGWVQIGETGRVLGAAVAQ